MKVKLFDQTVFDPTAKTALSIRDGVLEYYGQELGLEPADKVFTVYRSPATTANAAMRMRGIPVTDEHVDLDLKYDKFESSGKVEHAEMVDVSDVYVGATVAVRNKLSLSDTITPIIDAGKKELSLGYLSELKEHSSYDFEQTNILPHHLAVVRRGRCGSMCSFIDKKSVEQQEDNTMKIFLTKDGKLDLQKMKDALPELAECLKTLDEKDLEDIKLLVAPLADYMPEKEQKKDKNDPVKSADQDKDGDKKQGEGQKFSDEDMKKMVDAAVSKQLDGAVKRHVAVVDKAKDFLGDSFDFSGKSTAEIVGAVLEKEYPGQVFSDLQRDFAFDLLKAPEKFTDYSKFGDSKSSSEWGKDVEGEEI